MLPQSFFGSSHNAKIFNSVKLISFQKMMTSDNSLQNFEHNVAYSARNFVKSSSLISRKFETQSSPCVTESNGLILFLRIRGVVEQRLGHLFVILSSSYFFNETDLQLYLGNRPFAVNSSVHLVKKFEWQLIFCLNTLIFISQTHMQKFSTYFPAVFF